jgi:predicted nucleotide-binding protein
MEDLAVAEQVQLHLDHDAEVEIWREGTFVPSGYAFASLLDTAKRIDFALIVVSPVDSLSRRGTLYAVARDNVIFEAGLFGGALGQARVFFLQPRGFDLTLPTDLDGMTLLSWDPVKTNLASSVGPACTQLKAAMVTLGLRS